MICECGNKIKQGRVDLGYRTCLECGSPPIKPVIIPVAKSNYIVGNRRELANNNHKGPRV